MQFKLEMKNVARNKKDIVESEQAQQETDRLYGIGINPNSKVVEKIVTPSYEKPDHAEEKMKSRYSMWGFEFEACHKGLVTCQAGMLGIRNNLDLASQTLDAIDAVLLKVKQLATKEEKEALEKEMANSRAIVNRILTARIMCKAERMPPHPAWNEKCYQACRAILNAVLVIRQRHGWGIREADLEDEENSSDFLSSFGEE